VRADAQRNRDRIVEVARAFFRAKGFDAVSMDEVAKGAEVGPGTLYRHFPTKESLYDAVLEAWADKVNAAADRALTLDAPAREQLLTWLTDYAAMLTEHKGAAARITAALGDPGSPFAAKCQTYLNANQRLIDALDSAPRPGGRGNANQSACRRCGCSRRQQRASRRISGIDAPNRRRWTARSLTAAENAFEATLPALEGISVRRDDPERQARWFGEIRASANTACECRHRTIFPCWLPQQLLPASLKRVVLTKDNTRVGGRPPVIVST
jgi:AcrR family transcriptional regulator